MQHNETHWKTWKDISSKYNASWRDYDVSSMGHPQKHQGAKPNFWVCLGFVLYFRAMNAITLYYFYCGPYEIAPTKPHNDRYGRHGVGAFWKTSGSNLLQKLFIEAILSILDFSVSSGGPPLTSDTPQKTNNGKHQFQDVSPIKNWWFSIVMSFFGSYK